MKHSISATLACAFAVTSLAQIGSESSSETETTFGTELPTSNSASPSGLTSITPTGSFPSTPTSNPDALTTSIFLDSGEGIFGDNILANFTAKTFTASLVTVGPSGTVIDIACPFSATSTSECSFWNEGVDYTIRPGTEINRLAFSIPAFGSTTHITIDATCVGIPNPTSLSCVNTLVGTLEAPGTKTSSTTTVSSILDDPTYVPLLITAGLEKQQAIPEPTGAAAAYAARGAPMGVAGVVVAAMLV